MKAITYREYGSPDVLRLEEIEKPAPGEGEVLIRIRAASVNAMDCHFMRGEPRFIRLMTGVGKPKNPRLGADVAGIVEAVGSNVTDFKPGDEVFGVCRGAFAEYACAPGLKVAIKSASVSFEQAVGALQRDRRGGSDERPAQRRNALDPGNPMAITQFCDTNSVSPRGPPCRLSVLKSAPSRCSVHAFGVAAASDE